MPIDFHAESSYFFVRYPKLIEREVARGLDCDFVRSALQRAGFMNIEERSLWEIRRIYTNFDELREDLLARTGRSILHELSDAELVDLVDLVVYIKEQVHGDDLQQIVEQDRWTIWSAQKGEE